MPPTVQRGIISRNEPMKMKIRKLAERISEGLVRRFNIFIMPNDTVTME